MVGGLVAPPAEQEEEAAASNSQGVIFVLENAKLETAKVGKVCMLLAPTQSLALYSSNPLNGPVQPEDA